MRRSLEYNNELMKELTTVFILFFLFAFDRDFTTPTNNKNIENILIIYLLIYL
jgi:hypothetical protein